MMFLRILAVIEKEWIDASGDKIFLLSLLISPFISLLAFGYSFQGDLIQLPTSVIDYDGSNYSIKVVDAISQSDYFKIVNFNNLTIEESLSKINKSQLRAVIVIPPGFGSNLDNATTPIIKVYIDSSDYVVYNTLKAAIGGVMKDSIRSIATIIIENLELEKDQKQNIGDDIINLSDDMSRKIDVIKSEMDDVKGVISDIRKYISKSGVDLNKKDAVEERVNQSLVNISRNIYSLYASTVNLSINYPGNADIIQMQILLSNMSDSLNETGRLLGEINLSETRDSISSFKEDINAYEEIVNRVTKKTDELIAEYNEMKEKADELEFTFKTLKKEFLTKPLEYQEEYIFGDIRYIHYLTPGIMSMIIFDILVILVSINLIDEKVKKTFYRLSTTPIRKYELFTGKFLFFLMVGLLEGVYIILVSNILFGITFKAGFFSLSMLSFLIILTLLAAASIGIAILITVFVENMRQGLMFIPGLIIPFMLISQTFAPIEIMPWYMQYAARIAPTYYANIAMREIMMKGALLSDVSGEVTVLLIYSVVVLALGIILSKKRIE
ncbi:MAG: ABC transporter permease [archaeon]